jgi:four helix bundle protein
MTKEELKYRTKAFAVAVIKYIEMLPKTKANDVITYQIVKSATSIGANYRSACRGRSTAEFISKLNIVIEEADETSYWLEIIGETNTTIDKETLKKLSQESNELTAIFTASSKTIKANTNNQKLEISNQK